MSNQRTLCVFNLGWLPSTAAASTLAWERQWIACVWNDLTRTAAPIKTVTALQAAIEQLVAESAQSPTSSSTWLTAEMDREALARLLGEYAIDGLTEASAMFAIVPRLQGQAQAAVMRILIDEFGCGNPQRVHAALYRQLLQELGLSTDLHVYLDTVNVESLAFVNVYHWLTKRAPRVDAYLGALAYTEMAIPASFASLALACERLGIRQRTYFTEHVHIDPYHTQDALLALNAMAEAGLLDVQEAWVGALLAQQMGERAFAAALRTAQGVAAC